MITGRLFSSLSERWIGIATATLLSLCCFTPTAAQQQPPSPARPAAAPVARAAAPRPAAGGRGTAIVITAEALADRTRLSEALAAVPGVRVTPTGAAGWTVTTTRSPGCVADVFVDRLRVGGPGAGPFELDLIPVRSVARIEIYASSAWIPFEIPPRDGLCAVVIIRMQRT